MSAWTWKISNQMCLQEKKCVVVVISVGQKINSVYLCVSKEEQICTAECDAVAKEIEAGRCKF